MRKAPPDIPKLAGVVLAIVMLISGTSCDRGTQARQVMPLPDAAGARQAVESALESWRQEPALPLTAKPSDRIQFVDQQRRHGQPLRDFSVLRESASEGCRRFQVRLTLAEPEETRVVTYCVFGAGPTWVYRSEDFDMIMHWECSIPADPAQSPAAEDPR